MRIGTEGSVREWLDIEAAERVRRQGGEGGGGNGDAQDGAGSAEAEAVDEALKPAEISSLSEFGAFLLDKAEGYWTGFLRISPLLIVAVVILVLTWLLAKGVSWAATTIAGRTGARPAIVDLVGVVSKALIWILGTFAAISVVFPSVTPGSVLTGAGLGVAVIGIAFKDVFENFMAGFLLLIRKSMRIGDYVRCEDIEGRIEKTTLRDTYLRRVDGELVILPNSFLFKNPVHVWTNPDFRRFDIAVGVAYKEDVAEAREVIEKAMSGLDFGADKPPQVFATAFGASSVDFTVRWWAEPEPLDMFSSRDQVVEAVKAALDEAGIEIPFPYRTLTFDEPLPLARLDGDDGGDGGMNETGGEAGVEGERGQRGERHERVESDGRAERTGRTGRDGPISP